MFGMAGAERNFEVHVHVHVHVCQPVDTSMYYNKYMYYVICNVHVPVYAMYIGYTCVRCIYMYIHVYTCTYTVPRLRKNGAFILTGTVCAYICKCIIYIYKCIILVHIIICGPLQMALKFLSGAANEGFAAANALIGKVPALEGLPSFEQ